MAGKITVSTINDSSGVLATQNGMTGIAKAWVCFVGSSGAINASFNVSSVTRNSTGNYTITFTTAMPDAYFVTNFNYVNYQYNLPSLQSGQTTTTVTIATGNQFSGTTSLQDPSLVGVVINR